MIRIAIFSLLLTTPALAVDMHVTPTESPYCGTRNGMAETCWMSNGSYPRSRHTKNGWSCPLQYYVVRNRCEEET